MEVNDLLSIAVHQMKKLQHCCNEDQTNHTASHNCFFSWGGRRQRIFLGDTVLSLTSMHSHITIKFWLCIGRLENFDASDSASWQTLRALQIIIVLFDGPEDVRIRIGLVLCWSSIFD